ncbi:MAG: SHOCT domain-containing protein [Candidatus Dormiibacterota bacterium]
MILFPLVILVAVFVAFNLGCRGAWRGRGDGRAPWMDDRPRPEEAVGRARAILHERYARGEISTEEYRERMDQLF